ncbi:hypothetical protein [Sediminibacillus massiliensis]|uniref:hypothetical protein n=1 Tax=Sediminibacillus massiliensis TaxID=1926277 RepID=UPI0009886339|nr:hypothetical protein [Sediminibacillus massiliensis]
MVIIFKYYIKQFRNLKRFPSWKYFDKAAFLAITNLLVVAIALSAPSIKLLDLIFSIFFLTSLSYFSYLTCRILAAKLFNDAPKPYTNVIRMSDYKKPRRRRR